MSRKNSRRHQQSMRAIKQKLQQGRSATQSWAAIYASEFSFIAAETGRLLPVVQPVLPQWLTEFMETLPSGKPWSVDDPDPLIRMDVLYELAKQAPAAATHMYVAPSSADLNDGTGISSNIKRLDS